MYTKCGSIVDARQVFDRMKHRDLVSWNSLILGYAENGQGEIALDLFSRMKSQGWLPDRVTYVAAFKACASLAMEGNVNECLGHAKQIRSEISCKSDIYVQGALIDMYAKCGEMAEAQEVFHAMENPDISSWNALISGHADNGDATTALDLFARMKGQGYNPDHITTVAALKACTLLGDFDYGSKVHAEASSGDGRVVPMLVTCLVDFYAKCGNMVEAQKVFDSNPRKRGLRTWNALLAGYCRVGDNQAVFKLFEEMQDVGFQPSVVTFLCILTCCNHLGYVKKADNLFEEMTTKFGVAPAIEHYNCMVDMLGRSNTLDDSAALIRSMPWRPNAVTWMTLLGACVKWKNVGIGRLAFMSLVCLEEANATAHVLMAQIYGSKGMWEEQQMLMDTEKALWGNVKAATILPVSSVGGAQTRGVNLKNRIM